MAAADLAAGIGCADILAIPEIVLTVDLIDEQHTGFGEIIGRTHDPGPQVSSGDASHHTTGNEPNLTRPVALQRFGVTAGRFAKHMFGKHQWPGCVIGHRLHEIVADLYREVEASQEVRVLLGDDEGLNIGMVATQCGHHRPRRAPVDRTVPHIASQICMNETGPEAMRPVA